MSVGTSALSSKGSVVIGKSKAKKSKRTATNLGARTLVPWPELQRRLRLANIVVKLREKHDSGRKNERAEIAEVRDAFDRDERLRGMPFRSLYQLALARKRLGRDLKELVRKLGQGKALEIATLTDRDEVLRKRLVDTVIRGPKRRVSRIERFTIAELRSYIAKRRRGRASRRSSKPARPGGKRGPRVYWPGHLVRVLQLLMDDTTWARLRKASKMPESDEAPVKKPRTKSKPKVIKRRRKIRAVVQLDVPQLESMRTRLKKLVQMLSRTIKARKKSAPES